MSEWGIITRNFGFIDIFHTKCSTGVEAYWFGENLERRWASHEENRTCRFCRKELPDEIIFQALLLRDELK